MSELQGKKVVLYVENLYNDLEFWYPKLRLREADAEVIVAGPEAGAVYKSKFGMPATADVAFQDIDPNTIDGIIVPGGYAPDLMRRNEAAVALVRNAFELGIIIAHICHAGWVLISAGIVKGMRSTSYVAIKDDMVNAGALWEDAAVVVDKNLISSRTPDDLPVFCKAIIEQLALKYGA